MKIADETDEENDEIMMNENDEIMMNENDEILIPNVRVESYVTSLNTVLGTSSSQI